MRPVIIFLCAIFLISCHQSNNNNNYDDLVKAQLSSGVKCDTIFAGLVFGMNEKEVYEQLKSNLVNDSFYEVGKEIRYKFTTLLQSQYTVHILPEFKDHKLYKLTLFIPKDKTNREEDPFKSDEYAFYHFINIAGKYGIGKPGKYSNSIEFENALFKKIPDFIYIKGNCKVHLTRNHEAIWLHFNNLNNN